MHRTNQFGHFQKSASRFGDHVKVTGPKRGPYGDVVFQRRAADFPPKLSNLVARRVGQPAVSVMPTCQGLPIHRDRRLEIDLIASNIASGESKAGVIVSFLGPGSDQHQGNEERSGESHWSILYGKRHNLIRRIRRRERRSGVASCRVEESFGDFALTLDCTSPLWYLCCPCIRPSHDSLVSFLLP